MTFAHNATADWDTTVTDTSYKTHKKQKKTNNKNMMMELYDDITTTLKEQTSQRKEK